MLKISTHADACCVLMFHCVTWSFIISCRATVTEASCFPAILRRLTLSVIGWRSWWRHWAERKRCDSTPGCSWSPWSQWRAAPLWNTWLCICVRRPAERPEHHLHAADWKKCMMDCCKDATAGCRNQASASHEIPVRSLPLGSSGPSPPCCSLVPASRICRSAGRCFRRDRRGCVRSDRLF